MLGKEAQPVSHKLIKQKRHKPSCERLCCVWLESAGMAKLSLAKRWSCVS